MSSTEPEDALKGIERLIVWIGSPASLALHTVVFIAFFAVSLLQLISWGLMFAILTNVVSLEAIYLAIFIQMSVNRQSASLKVVEEDVGDIQEDIEELGENVEELGENVEELGENVEDLKEDVEDIQEDIGEIDKDDDDDTARVHRQAQMLDSLTNDVKAILKTLESLKTK
jgi:peptidoglycan hydrolase CwlO-like protein